MLLCVKFEESTPKIARYNGGNSYEREGLQGGPGIRGTQVKSSMRMKKCRNHLNDYF